MRHGDRYIAEAVNTLRTKGRIRVRVRVHTNTDVTYIVLKREDGQHEWRDTVDNEICKISPDIEDVERLLNFMNDMNCPAMVELVEMSESEGTDFMMSAGL